MVSELDLVNRVVINFVQRIVGEIYSESLFAATFDPTDLSGPSCMNGPSE